MAGTRSTRTCGVRAAPLAAIHAGPDPPSASRSSGPVHCPNADAPTSPQGCQATAEGSEVRSRPSIPSLRTSFGHPEVTSDRRACGMALCPTSRRSFGLLGAQPGPADLATRPASHGWLAESLAILRGHGRLAQSVRARGSHPRGHWFESSIAHHRDLEGRGEREDQAPPLGLVRTRPHLLASCHGTRY